jgi:hypothetical protein
VFTVFAVCAGAAIFGTGAFSTGVLVDIGSY